MADTIYVEDCDFHIMTKGMLNKHTIDASFGQYGSHNSIQQHPTFDIDKVTQAIALVV